MPDTVDQPKNDFWVFREGKKNVSTSSLIDRLVSSLVPGAPCAQTQIISALLCAGELESGLADANSPAASSAEKITDILASAMLGACQRLAELPSLFADLQHTAVPEQLLISPAEGFAYYALHPLDFAQLALSSAVNACCAVIGIRSIGTTLSAITAAAFRSQSYATARITVRPTGHPYQRETAFTKEQTKWVQKHRDCGACFFVTDEGPGRSGSSFLSVGDALVRHGVPATRIKFLGSRNVNPAELCARDAVPRWSQFSFSCPTPQSYQRFREETYIGGGSWRSHLFALNSHSPACWPQMERLKFLSRDRQSLFKFEGFGHFGEIIRERSARVAAAGFGCPPEDCGDGMTRYPVIAGVCETGDFASSSDLERIAEYCAFRVSEFSVANSIPSQLAEMVQFNLNSEFSIDLDLQCLNGTNQTLVDGRMQPHEWIRRPDGVLMKVDASSHGDDHFFPGPTDIAWDVAGAIVEWRLGTDAAKFLINRYTTLSGDHIRPRIQPFIAAYSTFRFAYCHMALGTGMSSEDGAKLRAAAEYYRAVCERTVESLHSLRK